MPPELRDLTSFSLDIDDWHSCHTSDDEAYQDALERNSVASFYTARDNASSAASVMYTSIALGSPSRLADADQALEHLILEKQRSSRMQHDPPELDEQETPACKRTRSLANRFRLSITAGARLPSPAVKARVPYLASSRRITTASRVISPSMSVSAQDVDGVTGIQSGLTSAGSVRVCITVLPDESAVQLRITPTIFCFGNIFLPAPTASTDYAAMLLGPEGSLTAEDNIYGEIERHDSEEHRTVPEPEPQVADADRDVPVARRAVESFSPSSSSGTAGPRFHSSRNEPNTPKDQTKVKRQAEDKTRKPGVGFPSSSLVQKLFSGFRASDGGNSHESLPPVTIHELGSSLLFASAAGQPARVALAVAACQSAPMVAAYIHAAQAHPVPVAEAPVADVGAADDAATVAHRLSANIFRNVLRAAAGGLAEVPPPLPSTSPRDTAFQSTEMATPHRDQVSASRATEETECHGRILAGDGGTSSPSHRASLSSEGSLHQSPPDTQQAPGFAALALLVGLASDAIPSGRDTIESDKLSGKASVEGSQAVGRLGSQNASVETLDCGLPMPELEQCESPVTRKVASPSAIAETVATESFPQEVANVELHEERTEAAPKALFGTCVHAATAAAVAAAAPTAVASPRTLSKRAYGTVARLVKKMNPNFHDSAVKSTVSINLANRPLPLDDPLSAATLVDTSDPPALGVPSADEADTCVPAEPSGSEGSGVNSSMDAEDPNEVNANLDITTSAAAEDSSLPMPEAQAAADLPAQDGGAPVMFVFGQEHARTAKHGKSRMSAPKSAAPHGDAGLTPDAAGRKRKADVEMLPTAKLPLTSAKTSIDAEQPQAPPHPTDVAPAHASTPSTEDVQDTAAAQASSPTTDLPSDDTAAGVANPDDDVQRPAVVEAIADEIHAQVTTEVVGQDTECASPGHVKEAPCKPDEPEETAPLVAISETSTVTAAVDGPSGAMNERQLPSEEPDVCKPEQAVSVTSIEVHAEEQPLPAPDEDSERTAELAEAQQVAETEAGEGQAQPETVLAAVPMCSGVKEVTITATTMAFRELPPVPEAGVVVGVHTGPAGGKHAVEAQEVGASHQAAQTKLEVKSHDLEDHCSGRSTDEAPTSPGEVTGPGAGTVDTKPPVEKAGVQQAKPAEKDTAVEPSEAQPKTVMGRLLSGKCLFGCFRR